MFQPEIEQWKLSNYYRTFWPFILAAGILAPGVLYGLLRGSGFVVWWVFKGFKPIGN
jgi:hypothetical protein